MSFAILCDVSVQKLIAMFLKLVQSLTSYASLHVLYGNIDQILLNKLHGPMYCEIGVTCVYTGHVFYAIL